MDNFVHLYVHSEYSLLDGAARASMILWRGRGTGPNGDKAITDHGASVRRCGILACCYAGGGLPVIGCEVYVANGKLTDETRPERVCPSWCFWRKTNQGYIEI